MNSVHDMGGMHGLGPIEPEANEPVFHHWWEGRAHGIALAMGAWGKWNIDASRHARERIPGPIYLRMTYYEKWIAGLCDLMVRMGLVSARELTTGIPDPGTPKAKPPVDGKAARDGIFSVHPYSRDIQIVPRFKAGDHVRTKNLHTTGHTRLPRYVRARAGVIVADHGAFVFPDANAHFAGEQPQPLYSVRFESRELWGETASPRDAVYVDLWEAYLDPA